MKSIFHKTLIATFLSATLGSVAIAADDYKDTLDSRTADNEELNTQGQDNRLNKSNEGKAPCKDDMNAAGKSHSHKQKNAAPEDRPLTEHQGNVTDDVQNTSENTGESDDPEMKRYDAEGRQVTDHQGNVTDDVQNTNRKSGDRDQRDYGSEDRPLSDHQGNVIEEEEEEEEETSFRLNGKMMDSSEMDVQVEKYLNSYIIAHQDMTSYMSHVSSR